ncbi:hypothetical protein SDC9_200532 [bioreactor metagenome]|uniref:Uncharacterized protein n=1 Tax=bioreactor metagenome TaxID=1076179 RepID=A0A645IRA0_9ZZZZ
MDQTDLSHQIFNLIALQMTDKMPAHRSYNLIHLGQKFLNLIFSKIINTGVNNCLCFFHTSVFGHPHQRYVFRNIFFNCRNVFCNDILCHSISLLSLKIYG